MSINLMGPIGEGNESNAVIKTNNLGKKLEKSIAKKESKNKK